MSTIVVGGIGCVFVALMAATSNDAAAAWLGRRRWSLLHTVGAYWIWEIFLVSYLFRVAAAPANALPLALVLGAWGLRLAHDGARRRSRRPERARAARPRSGSPTRAGVLPSPA